jgi:hypothetical protein
MVSNMFVARLAASAASVLLVSGCEPLFHLSVYNNAGRDLRISLSPSGETTWNFGEFITFNNYQGTVVRWAEGGLLFEVLDEQGNHYRYTIDTWREDSKETYGTLRYVGTPGPEGPFADPAQLKSKRPRDARVCMRLDKDMSLYWWDRNCHDMASDNGVMPKQPLIFPVPPER